MIEFKRISGRTYHLLAIASDTETDEEMVVCQEVTEDDHNIYIVPKTRFDGGDWNRNFITLPRFETRCAYRHFKGNLYYVLALGYNVVTGQFMVVYQALYGDRGYFVRNLDMFYERVPEGRPDNHTHQTYRFERFEGKNIL